MGVCADDLRPTGWIRGRINK